MTREQRDVLRRDACRMKLCGQGVAEAMETDALGKAKIFEVVAELVQKSLAIPAIARTALLVLAGRQMREQSGMATGLDVGNEIQEAGIDHLRMQRDLADCTLAFEALAGLSTTRLGEIIVCRHSDSHAPLTLFQDDVSNFQLRDFIDACPCVKA